MSSGRVIITGASGLLGRSVFQAFSQDKSWTTLGLAFSRTGENFRKVDITDTNQVEKLLEEVKPTAIVHCAAKRRPDDVEKQAEATHKLNVEATQNLCKQADKMGAFVVYISSDYVFDGESPPYRHDAKTNPLNKYGVSKLEGEVVTLQVSKGNMVLRIPVLYGQIEDLDESAVTTIFKALQDTSKDYEMSDYERRFPTYCADLAYTLKQMVEYKLKDSTMSGIFHWSGDENMTKYDMVMGMADVFNLPTNHIKANKNPSGGAKRPYDAHLDSERLEKLGLGKRTPFKIAIKECLMPFLKT